METNNPPPPKLAIGITQPETPATSAASAATDIGVIVHKNAIIAKIPPVNLSNL